MLLKMKTSLCGPDVSLSRDDEHDFEDHREGMRLCDAAFAVPANAQARAELEAVRAEVAAELADAGDDQAADAPTDQPEQQPAPETPAVDQAETPPAGEATPPAADAAPKTRVTKPKAPKA